MSNTSKRGSRKSDCPIHFALRLLGDAWTLLIIRDIVFNGKSSFSEFLHSGEGIASNILADRLAYLEAEGVLSHEGITRRETRSASRSVYRLTSKGIDLVPILLEIINWSARYDPNTATPRQFIRRLRSEKDALIEDIQGPLLANIHATANKTSSSDKISLRRRAVDSHRKMTKNLRQNVGRKT